jgi:NAD-dependent DNA ligase
MAELVKKLLNPTKDSLEIASNFSIDELETIIKYTTEKYYNTSKSVITDELYDILIDFLKLKSPKSIVLKTIGANVKSKNKVQLDYWLGSMNKIKPGTNQLDIWINKFKSPYHLSDKLDGVSGLLIYRLNGTINLYTRGTATEGTDITPLIKYLHVPDFKTVSKYCATNNIKGELNLIAFRGELIMKESTFNKNWGDVFKNGRNTVAGLVNSKTINPEVASTTDFVLYEVVDPFYSIDKQFKILNDLGFTVAFNKKIDKDLTFELLSKYLQDRRAKSVYKIDGIIATSITNQERNIKANPLYAFAFKDILEDQMAKTEVISVEWNISKDGFIIPTILLNPINIGGVEIKRTTGFNAKFIVDNVIGPGSMLEIIRSGDVIPKVHKVLNPSKSGKPDMPKGKWHWNETKVDIQLDDVITNPQVLIRNIFYFFSNLDTKGLGMKTVEKLVDAGLDTVKKIISADEKDFLKVEGFAIKSAQNLVESIKQVLTNVLLYKLMAASNKLGPGIGEERVKQIVTLYPNIIIDYKKWSDDDFIKKIKAINGWEEKTARLLVSNFNTFVVFYDSIKKYITLEPITKSTGKFTDKVVVFTGFRDKDLQSQIEKQGGKIGSSISKNTDFLIIVDQSVLDKQTDKITKAQELNIKIITKDQLIKLLNK